MKTNELLDKISEFFQTDDRGAAAVYLFGSAARGTDTPASDIDIGVLYRESPPRSLDGPSLGLA